MFLIGAAVHEGLCARLQFGLEMMKAIALLIGASSRLSRAS
jgi:hypothetical protein